MFTCKQVSKTLENHNYEDLSPLRKFLVRFHIAICMVCGRYNTQVVEMHKLTRCFHNHVESDDLDVEVTLSEEKRAELKKALSSEKPEESRAGNAQ